MLRRQASLIATVCFACACGEKFTTFTPAGDGGSGAMEAAGGADGGASPAGGGAGGGGAGSGGGGAAGFDPARDPTAEIQHPGGGMECRKRNVALQFIGAGTDPQDGNLTGDALAWESDVEGDIGTGATFTHAPTIAGEQLITLTATDSDQNAGSDQIALTIADRCP